MKIAGISDIHGMWGEEVKLKDGELRYATRIQWPDADVLCLAGDILGNYRGDRIDPSLQMQEAAALNRFLGGLVDGHKDLDQKYKHVVVVAGNHDWCFQLSSEAGKLFDHPNVHYLQDSGVDIDGVKFWGSPWQPWFWDWAFNFPDHHANYARYRSHARGTWGMIPDDCNVLITHGPPEQILDECPDGRRVGCQFLRERTMQLKDLELHIFGHIHYSYGTKIMGGLGNYRVAYMNAAACNEAYEPINPVQVIEIRGTK